MKSNVEQIMKNYRTAIKEIDMKYEVKQVKKPNLKGTSDIEQKIAYEYDLIDKLKYEGEENNKQLIENSKSRLEANMEEKEKILEDNQKAEDRYQKAIARREEKLSEVAKLRNSKVQLDSGREVTLAEKDELDKNSIRDNAIRELTTEGKSISEQLQIKEQELTDKKEELQKQREEQLKSKKSELEQKRNDLFYFKYEFDENHEIINKADQVKLNKDCKKLEKEIEKIEKEDFSKQLKPIEKEIKKLKEEQTKCNEYLAELKEPSKQFESFTNAWYEVKQEESQNIQTTQQQETQQNENQAITANEFMHDMLRIQQTTNPKELDELFSILEEKYKDSSDTWVNRILSALNRQKGIIDENINKSKGIYNQQEKEEIETEEKQKGDSGRTEAEKLADVLSELYKKKATEEIETEKPKYEEPHGESEHDDRYEELDFNIPSIFDDKKNPYQTLENTDHVEEGKFRHDVNTEKNIIISRIEIEEATGYVRIIDDKGQTIYDKQFEYDKENGDFNLCDEYTMDIDDEKLDELSQKMKKIEKSLKDEYGEDVAAEKFEDVDTRVLYALGEMGDSYIEDYVWSICEKEETMPFELGYDLKDIYNTDMTLDEIKDVQEFSKIAKKQNKEMVDVKKDNPFKRAYGRIKKGIQERKERKLLDSGNISKSKLKNGAKRIIKGIYKEAKIHGMYLRGKLTRENPLKTKSNVRQFKDQYKAKVDEEKAKEAMNNNVKETPVQERDNFDINL